MPKKRIGEANRINRVIYKLLPRNHLDPQRIDVVLDTKYVFVVLEMHYKPN